MDPQFVEKIVHEVKSQGVFDEFRKDSMADVDTKPAYQNLRQRVDTAVMNFLSEQKWTPETNKNQLRERLRRHITESGFLDVGVERIVDQVVNPKIGSIFQPRIEEIAYKYLGLPPPPPQVKCEPPPIIAPFPPLPLNGPTLNVETGGLLPTDLEQVSPDSDKATIKSECKSEPQDMDLEMDKDDDESPPFEPLAPCNSSPKRETFTQDSQETLGDTKNAKVNVESTTEDQPQMDTETQDTTVSTNTPEAADSEKEASHFVDVAASQESQLSQVSSESRISSLSQEFTSNGANLLKVHQLESAAVNISEEAQMPKFNDNSSEANGASGGNQNGTQLHFDIKKDEIKFEGTERKINLPPPAAANTKDTSDGEQPVISDDTQPPTTSPLHEDLSTTRTPPTAAPTHESSFESSLEDTTSMQLANTENQPLLDAAQVKPDDAGDVQPSTTTLPPPTPTRDKDEKHSHSSSSSSSRHKRHSKDKYRSRDSRARSKSKQRDQSSDSRRHSSHRSKHSSSSSSKNNTSNSSKTSESGQRSERSSTAKSYHSSSSRSDESKRREKERDRERRGSDRKHSTSNGRESSSSYHTSNHKKGDGSKSGEKGANGGKVAPSVDDHNESKDKVYRRKSSDSNDEDKSSAGTGGAAGGPAPAAASTASTSSTTTTAASQKKTSTNNNADSNTTTNTTPKSKSKKTASATNDDTDSKVDALQQQQQQQHKVVILDELLENPSTSFINLEANATTSHMQVVRNAPSATASAEGQDEAESPTTITTKTTTKTTNEQEENPSTSIITPEANANSNRVDNTPESCSPVSAEEQEESETIDEDENLLFFENKNSDKFSERLKLLESAMQLCRGSDNSDPLDASSQCSEQENKSTDMESKIDETSSSGSGHPAAGVDANSAVASGAGVVNATQVTLTVECGSISNNSSSSGFSRQAQMDMQLDSQQTPPKRFKCNGYDDGDRGDGDGGGGGGGGDGGDGDGERDGDDTDALRCRQKPSPTPSDTSSGNSKENLMFERNTQAVGIRQKPHGVLDKRTSTIAKLTQQQRYSSEDLYKPRPVLSQRSRRRGLDSAT